MTSNDKAVCLSGLAIAALLFFIAASRSNAHPPIPENDTAYERPFAGLNSFALVAGGETDNMPGYEWRWPFNEMSRYNTNLTALPCRYPRVSGQNLTAIIHKGWDPMMLPAKRDAAWTERPPAEVMI
jgi:hypothetical protein